jgi:fatty-acyl-CoA synthase
VLNECVAYHARARPGKTACVDLATGTRLTYAGLQHRSLQMAAVLARLAGPAAARGARVAVLARNSADVVCLHLACRHVGAVFVPLNWRLSAAELRVLVQIAGPMLLIVDAEFAPLAAQLREAAPEAQVLELGHEGSLEWQLARGGASGFAAERPVDQQLVTLLFTSGTTGRPKGVMVTSGNASATARNYGLSARVDSASVFLCDMPMFHVVGLFAVTNTVLEAGGTLLVSAQFSAEQTLARLADAALGITHYFCVPQMAKQLREHAAFDPQPFRRLTALQTGGAPHAAEAVRAWVEDGVRCVDGYGMSEVGTAIGMPPDDLDLLRLKAGSVGLPAVCIEARLVDRAGRDVGGDEAGEIWLRGPSVTPGYWQDPQTSAAAFHDGWFRTGDVARRDADGFFTMMDRWKDMFISGGENVYPAEVEAVLREIPGVQEVAVVGVADDRWGEVGAAFVVLAPDARLTLEEVQARCRLGLAGYKIPRRLHVLEELPRTSLGKVRKDALRTQRFDDDRARVASE